jgi:threonine synthase
MRKILIHTVNLTTLMLRCKVCGSIFEDKPAYVCENCFGPLEVIYDWEKIKESVSKQKIERGVKSLWRYRDFLPVSTDPVDLGAGFTRFIHARNLGEKIGLKNLYLIDDSTNPTYSFKDRVVSVAVTKALEFGMKALGCASTGNLAGSLAAHAAKVGMKAYIFVPAGIEKTKLIQAAVHGAEIIEVDGNYDHANRIATELADKYPEWGFVNINLRPYYVEGSKTLAYEAVERLGWESPDQVVVPMASGALLTSIHRGFEDFIEVGFTDSIPVFNGAQPEGFPISAAVKNGGDIKPLKSIRTIVHSLAIGNPASGYSAKEVIETTKGYAEDPSDSEVIEAVKLLAKTEGIFTELAGGTVIATLIRLVEAGRIDLDERVVIYLTGNGLKTAEVFSREVETLKVSAYEEVIAW